MKTVEKLVTPQWAKQVLETRNPRNRDLNEDIAKAYAVEMRAGRWLHTHQGIAFDENGDLKDGQKRLRAVVLCGIPQKMNVSTYDKSKFNNGDIEMDVMDVIDRHQFRSIGAQLKLSHDCKNGKAVAAIVRAIAMLYSNDLQRLNITTLQTVAILEAIRKSVDWAMEIRSLNPRRCHSRILAACIIYHSKFPTRATEFLGSYVTSIGWSAGCPERALDLWFQNHPGLVNHRITAMEATAAALVYHHNGEKVKILRLSESSVAWLERLNPELQQAVRGIIAQ